MDISDSIQDYGSQRTLHNISTSSITEYVEQLTLFARHLLSIGIIDTHDVTLRHVRDYLAIRRQACKQSTVCSNRAILAGWVRYLIEIGQSNIDMAAFPAVAAPKPDELRRIRVRADEVDRIQRYLRARLRKRRNARALECLVLFDLLFGVGLRISEVANVRMTHIDLRAAELYIPYSKGSYPRYVALPPSVLPALRLLISSRGDYVFAKADGRPCRPTALARQIARIGRQCDVTLTSHCGRRHCLSRLAAVNLLAAKAQAGHRNLTATLAYIVEDCAIIHAAMDSADPLASI